MRGASCASSTGGSTATVRTTRRPRPRGAGGGGLMWWTTLLLALREIRRNLLRSFLTILGIVIGVAAVITMVTLGNGATQAVSDQISSLGSNLLMIRPGQRLGPARDAAGAPPFKEADARGARGAGRRHPRGGAGGRTAASTVVYGARNWSTVGHRHHQCLLRDQQLAAGRRPHLHRGRGARRRGGLPDRRDRAARAVRRAGSAGRAICASSSSPARSSACWRPRARPRWARTRTTP